MTHWTAALDDDKSLRAIYGENLPSLNDIELAGIKLDFQRGCVLIDLDLRDYPQPAPKKWTERKYNTTSIQIWLGTPTSTEWRGTTASGLANAILRRDISSVIMEIVGADLSFACRSDFAYLSSVSGYQSSERPIPD